MNSEDSSNIQSKLEKTKEEWKYLKIAFLASIYSITLISLLFLLLFPALFSHTVNNVLYNNYESYFSKDPLITSILIECSNQTTKTEQILCVHHIFENDFEYINRNRTLTAPLESPQEIFSEGGICRDAAVFYCTTFKRLGIECDYIFRSNQFSSEKHVFNIVYAKTGTYEGCIIDQQDIMCWRG